VAPGLIISTRTTFDHHIKPYKNTIDRIKFFVPQLRSRGMAEDVDDNIIDSWEDADAEVSVLPDYLV